MDPHLPRRRGKGRALNLRHHCWETGLSHRQHLDPARLDSARRSNLPRRMTQSQPNGIFFIGVILLAMIILPWLFRKIFL